MSDTIPVWEKSVLIPTRRNTVQQGTRFAHFLRQLRKALWVWHRAFSCFERPDAGSTMGAQ
jgi:hypothetical protein